MKRFKGLTSPARVTELDFEDMFEDDGWKLRAERLQVRRWRKLKHQML
jgi:hypothetical protein